MAVTVTVEPTVTEFALKASDVLAADAGTINRHISSAQAAKRPIHFFCMVFSLYCTICMIPSKCFCTRSRSRIFTFPSLLTSQAV